MASPVPAPPVKLFIATLHRPDAPLDQAISECVAKWGETDYISADFPFTATHYYEPEMGPGLQRRFYSFRKLVPPELLADIKLATNELEGRFLSDTGRRINLDPGYLDYYKVVLASTKHGGMKIHLRNGVYADMTLVMNKGKWESFTWGFPDFKSGAYDAVLCQIRDLYKAQVKPIR